VLPGQFLVEINTLASATASALPEIAVRCDQLVRDFWEGAKDLDLFLAGAEYGARREAHRLILRVIPGERQELGLLEPVDQPMFAQYIAPAHIAHGSPVETSVHCHRNSGS
jgi:hypothetical protein